MRYAKSALRHPRYPACARRPGWWTALMCVGVVAAGEPPAVAKGGCLGNERAQRSPSQSATSCGNRMVCTRAHEAWVRAGMRVRQGCGSATAHGSPRGLRAKVARQTRSRGRRGSDSPAPSTRRVGAPPPASARAVDRGHARAPAPREWAVEDQAPRCAVRLRQAMMNCALRPSSERDERAAAGRDLRVRTSLKVSGALLVSVQLQPENVAFSAVVAGASCHSVVNVALRNGRWQVSQPCASPACRQTHSIRLRPRLNGGAAPCEYRKSRCLSARLSNSTRTSVLFYQ